MYRQIDVPSLLLVTFGLCSLWISLAAGQCTFPTDLQSGTWISSDQGSLTFNSTYMSGYTVNGYGTKSFYCEVASGDYYIVKSEQFTMFSDQVIAFMCLTFTNIKTNLYRYTVHSAEVANAANQRIVFAGTTTAANAATACTDTTHTEFSILMVDGQIDSLKIQCPDVMLATFTYSFNGTDCANFTGGLDICTDLYKMDYNYTACSTVVGYSAAGELNCLYSTTSGTATQVTMYNLDNSTDESTTYRFSCFMFESSGSYVYATQYPKYCTSTQNSTSVEGPGATLTLQAGTTCVPTTDSTAAVSSASLVAGLVAGIFILLLLIALVIGYCCYQKNKKVQPVGKAPIDTETVGTSRMPNATDDKRNLINGGAVTEQYNDRNLTDKEKLRTRRSNKNNTDDDNMKQSKSRSKTNKRVKKTSHGMSKLKTKKAKKSKRKKRKKNKQRSVSKSHLVERDKDNYEDDIEPTSSGAEMLPMKSIRVHVPIGCLSTIAEDEQEEEDQLILDHILVESDSIDEHDYANREVADTQTDTVTQELITGTKLNREPFNLNNNKDTVHKRDTMDEFPFHYISSEIRLPEQLAEQDNVMTPWENNIEPSVPPLSSVHLKGNNKNTIIDDDIGYQNLNTFQNIPDDWDIFNKVSTANAAPLSNVETFNFINEKPHKNGKKRTKKLNDIIIPKNKQVERDNDIHDPITQVSLDIEREMSILSNCYSPVQSVTTNNGLDEPMKSLPADSEQPPPPLQTQLPSLTGRRYTPREQVRNTAVNIPTSRPPLLEKNKQIEKDNDIHDPITQVSLDAEREMSSSSNFYSPVQSVTTGNGLDETMKSLPADIEQPPSPLQTHLPSLTGRRYTPREQVRKTLVNIPTSRPPLLEKSYSAPEYTLPSVNEFQKERPSIFRFKKKIVPLEDTKKNNISVKPSPVAWDDKEGNTLKFPQITPKPKKTKTKSPESQTKTIEKLENPVNSQEDASVEKLSSIKKRRSKRKKAHKVDIDTKRFFDSAEQTDGARPGSENLKGLISRIKKSTDSDITTNKQTIEDVLADRSRRQYQL